MNTVLRLTQPGRFRIMKPSFSRQSMAVEASERVFVIRLDSIQFDDCDDEFNGIASIGVTQNENVKFIPRADGDG